MRFMGTEIGETEMKKRVLAIILCMTIALGVVGCGSNNCRNSAEEHMLETIGGDIEYEIFYDKDTKVMYYRAYRGGVTPLYNADGTLRVYEGDTE